MANTKTATATKPARKPAGVAAKPAAPAKVTNKTPASVTPEKRSRGKPLSPEAAKVRRRMIATMLKQIETNPKDREVTVKLVTKALKLKKVTVSNCIRWAEKDIGVINRAGYKLKAAGEPGRKEVFYLIDAKALKRAAKCLDEGKEIPKVQKAA